MRSTQDLTSDIRLIEIAPSGDFVAPTPGSHINVAVLIGERPDVRSYSIVGPCHDGVYRIAVKRPRIRAAARPTCGRWRRARASG